MVIREVIENGTRDYHKSDNNKYIIQVETGNKYVEAIDIMPCQYTYIESDEDIEIINEEDINIVSETKKEEI